jgi:heme/copper-type cytochrome/quinol oxidase subunit 2
MLDDALADALSDPAALLQLVALLMVLLTVAVAALTSIITVHLVLRRREAAVPQVSAPQMVPAQMIPAQILAVISAAAYAVVGAHRLIHVGEWPHGSGWTTEVRQRHHVSHSPRA